MFSITRARSLKRNFSLVICTPKIFESRQKNYLLFISTRVDTTVIRLSGSNYSKFFASIISRNYNVYTMCNSLSLLLSYSVMRLLGISRLNESRVYPVAELSTLKVTCHHILPCVLHRPETVNQFTLQHFALQSRLRLNIVNERVTCSEEK